MSAQHSILEKRICLCIYIYLYIDIKASNFNSMLKWSQGKKEKQETSQKCYFNLDWVGSISNNITFCRSNTKYLFMITQIIMLKRR